MCQNSSWRCGLFEGGGGSFDGWDFIEFLLYPQKLRYKFTILAKLRTTILPEQYPREQTTMTILGPCEHKDYELLVGLSSDATSMPVKRNNWCFWLIESLRYCILAMRG